MNYITIVNRVLTRLREANVATVGETEYSALIGEFVNDIKEEMEDKHAWQSLQGTVQFSTVASQRTYDLTAIKSAGGDVDNTSTVLTERAQMLYETRKHRLPISTGKTSIPMIFDTTTTPGFRLREMEKNNLVSQRTMDTAQFDSKVGWYALSYEVGASLSVGPHIEFYPLITAIRGFTTRWYIPQDYLDTSKSATEIKIPYRPLILGAWYLALNERGEEIGEPGQIAETRYQDSLNDAVDIDIESQNRLNKLEVFED